MRSLIYVADPRWPQVRSGGFGGFLEAPRAARFGLARRGASFALVLFGRGTRMAKSTEIATRSDEQIVELSRLQPRLNDSDLRSVETFEDAVASIEAEYGGVADIADFLGNGFSVLATADKYKLVGTPLIILEWRFNSGDQGLFVSATVVTQDNARLIINDGSTGIYAQLRDLSDEQGRFGGLRVPKGLRASEYDTCAECGRPRRKDDAVCANERCGDESDRRARGTTYYLDTSA